MILRKDGKLMSRAGKLIYREPEYFEMIVKTDNTGTSNNNQFTIPTTGGGYNYTVETEEQLLTGRTGDTTLEWASAGTYWVRITGDFPRIFFNNSGDRLKLLEVSNWGNIVWSSMQNAFFGCGNFNITANDAPNLSNVTSMGSMFNGASVFNRDISSWNVSNVTSMGSMFNGASVFNADISSWNVSNVTSMNSMFNGASAFNGDISSWNVSNVLFMSSMFNGASVFNADISSWNVSNVINMVAMFNGASVFNRDISSWNVSNVTSMGSMFRDASAFNRDLSGWCVEEIASEPSSFDSGATSWVLPRPNWGAPC